MGKPQVDSGETLVIREIIANGGIRVVFQPLLDMFTRKVFAYEALVRCQAFAHPPALLKAAVEQKACGELGRAIRELAVEGCPDYPLFLNIHPAEFGEGWIVRPDDPMFSHDQEIFLEITESVPITHFSHCTSVLAEVRDKDIRLAVDDLGAGYSNLKYISDLNPEIVKLDMSLIRDLGSETRQLQLVTSLVRLCTDLGARVVAEGIETPEEMAAVQQTGAHFGQGYLIAKPDAPPPKVNGIATTK